MNIDLDIDTNINLNNIARTYVAVKVYTKNIVSISISTASTSIASTITTMAIMNPDLKYANQGYSYYK